MAASPANKATVVKMEAYRFSLRLPTGSPMMSIYPPPARRSFVDRTAPQDP
jgi:hypothetical protein